jgi:K+-transporting ATPase ATPase C chain
MKAWLSEMRRAALAVILLAVLLCGAYPLAVRGLGRLLFPGKADGSLLKRGDRTVGSALIAQPFHAPGYFHPRPSAVGYSCSRAVSGGSNLGPLSRALGRQMAMRAMEYRRENGLSPAFLIPGEALSASASGLDPHISPADAAVQAARVARARKMSEEQVRRWIRNLREGRQLGLFGEPRINVLRLNLALDAMSKAPDGPAHE